jgi:hypothetical protein
MPAMMRVDARLTADVAAAWLAKARPAQTDEGPTDDLTVPGRAPSDLVDVVLAEVLQDTPSPTIQRLLITRLGISEADAKLAVDRTLGGVMRAGTDPRNRPDPDKDPVAYEGYRRASADPALRSQVRGG